MGPQHVRPLRSHCHKDHACQTVYARPRLPGNRAVAAVLGDPGAGAEAFPDPRAFVPLPPTDPLPPLPARIPLTLDQKTYALCLDPRAAEPDQLRPLFPPYSADRMQLYPVAPFVN